MQKVGSTSARSKQDDAETRGCEASNASNAFDLSVLSGLCSPMLGCNVHTDAKVKEDFVIDWVTA